MDDTARAARWFLGKDLHVFYIAWNLETRTTDVTLMAVILSRIAQGLKIESFILVVVAMAVGRGDTVATKTRNQPCSIGLVVEPDQIKGSKLQ